MPTGVTVSSYLWTPTGGLTPINCHCHFGLGALYRRIGKLEQARSELSAAIDLYRSMEMTFWLDRAEAELKMNS